MQAPLKRVSFMSERGNKLSGWLVTFSILALMATACRADEPVKLDPGNPRYLMFRGRSTILVGSSEHYGAVLNASFDYHRYLDTLDAAGLNVTRIFAGSYRERPGRFGVLPGGNYSDMEIVGNTLAPQGNDYLAPWPRSAVPDALDRGRKFDLARWDPRFFRRLKDFVSAASRHGIVVEVSLFSNFYVETVGERFWEISPWNNQNNINGIGRFSGDEALTLKHPELTAIQDALVRKMINELHEFGNVYYEICNEPDPPSLEWQRHIAETIQSEEAKYRFHHLIAQEVGVGAQKVEERLPQASMIAFHNSEAEAVSVNEALGLPIIHNESVFDFTDAANRVAAWRFLLAGGAMYLGTDYSFTVGHEDGSFAVPPGGAGGGSRTARTQLAFLHRFMQGLPYAAMSPQPEIVRAGLPLDAHAWALGLTGKLYAIYFYHGQSSVFKGITVEQGPRQLSLVFALPPGRYLASWIDPKTGATLGTSDLIGGPQVNLEASPQYSEDIVLQLSCEGRSGCS
jgi:Family of unknown function (DUF6298)